MQPLIAQQKNMKLGKLVAIDSILKHLETQRDAFCETNINEQANLKFLGRKILY